MFCTSEKIIKLAAEVGEKPNISKIVFIEGAHSYYLLLQVSRPSSSMRMAGASAGTQDGPKLSASSSVCSLPVSVPTRTSMLIPSYVSKPHSFLHPTH